MTALYPHCTKGQEYERCCNGKQRRGPGPRCGVAFYEGGAMADNLDGLLAVSRLAGVAQKGSALLPVDRP